MSESIVPHVAIAVSLAEAMATLNLVNRLATAKPKGSKVYTAEDRLRDIATASREALESCESRRKEMCE